MNNKSFLSIEENPNLAIKIQPLSYPVSSKDANSTVAGQIGIFFIYPLHKVSSLFMFFLEPFIRQ